jgi:RNA polymerase sigma-70 factor (ECF subfamily)
MDDFGILVAQQMPKLQGFARSLTRDTVTAEDLVQECIARALAREHLWQAGTNLRAWLFTMLHNLHINHVRRGTRHGSTLPIEDFESTLAIAAPQMASHQLRDMERALSLLPASQRALIMLIGVEGMGYGQAAAVLHLQVGTVRSRLSRGRKALRSLMGTGDESIGRLTPLPAKPFTFEGYFRARENSGMAKWSTGSGGAGAQISANGRPHSEPASQIN